MRCLSLQQPFAWGICAGIKDIENRSWSTSYRGLVAIHAGAAKDRIKNLSAEYPQAAELLQRLPLGAIVGVAELVDIVTMSPSLEVNPHATGTYCWKFAEPRFLQEPIPMRGKLQLFSLDEAVAQQVESQLAEYVQAVVEKTELKLLKSTLDLSETELLTYRMDSYANLNDYNNAERCAAHAIKLNASEPHFYSQRAIYRGYLGRFQECIDDCTTAISLDNGCATDFFVRACAHARLGDKLQAKEDHARAKNLDPDVISLTQNPYKGITPQG